ILLFKHFEGINGLRDALLSDLAQTLFKQLTPDKIDVFANRHNLAPTHAEPWKKIFVGGSDDHGGQFAASAYTETPAAESVTKFLEYIRNGNCSARGYGGTPLALSHGFYNTVVRFIEDHFQEKLGPGAALLEQISSGNMVESMQAVSAIAPILVILTPYIYGFHSQAPSRKWLRGIFKELTGETPVALQNCKRAWFTDTLDDVNGVATTIRKMTAAGAAAGNELTVVTSHSNLQTYKIPIKNFPPIGEFELPEYELQKLSFPPILRMLDYIQREKFTEIIIS